jgi:hypothetical protein
MLRIGMQDWLTIIFLALGLAGVLFGWWQWRRTKSLEAARREDLWAALESAQHLVDDQTQVERFAKKHDDQELSRALWLNHQASSDHYVTLVGQYLSQEPSFKYAELERLCEIGFINRQWQEERWRFLLSRRRENVGVVPPIQFIKPDFPAMPSALERAVKAATNAESRNGSEGKTPSKT